MQTRVRWWRRTKYLWMFALFALVLNRTAANDLRSLSLLALCLFVGLTIVSGVGFWARNSQLKRALIEWLNAGHRPAHPREWSELDTRELERLTREWESLGFVQRGDFASGKEEALIEALFSRLLEHQSEGAIVELVQHTTPQKATYFVSIIESFWGEREPVLCLARELEAQPWLPGEPVQASSSDAVERLRADDVELWMLATHNQPLGSFDSLNRHPRALVSRLAVGASPTQLWQVHCQRSAVIEARLHSQPLRGDLVPLMYAHARLLHTLAAQRLKAISVWGMLRFNFVPPSPTPAFFDGDLAPLNRAT